MTRIWLALPVLIFSAAVSMIAELLTDLGDAMLRLSNRIAGDRDGVGRWRDV